MNNTLIIRYLTLLDLHLDQEYTIESLKYNYRRLSKLYHPDTASDMYKDGNKFKEFLNAYEYLKDNINNINELIRNGFNSNDNHCYRDFDWNDYFDEKERREREERARKQREFEERERRAAEEKTKKEEEERKKREEEQKRQNEINEEKEKNRLVNYKKVLKSILEKKVLDSKKEYSEENYKLITAKIYEFYNTIDSYDLYNKLQNEYLKFEEDLQLIKTIDQEKFLKNVKYVFGAILGVTICVLFYLVINSIFIVPNQKYEKAKDLVKSGQYSQAIEIYESLNGYRDSENQSQIARICIYCQNRNFNIASGMIEGIGGTTTYYYDYDGGNAVDNNAEKKGYNFLGWSYTGFEINDVEYKLTINYKALYDIEYYMVIYHLNGGTISEQISQYTVEDSFDIPNPTKEGYIFQGWRVNSLTDLFYDLKIEKGTTGNFILSAVWDAADFTVRFDETCGSLANTSIDLHYDQYYVPEVPSLEGYEFLGWYLGENRYTNNGYWKEEENLTLSAKWSPIVYTILYNSNDGTNMINRQMFIYNENSKLNENKYIRTGYEFKGWSNDPKSNEIVFVDKQEICNISSINNDKINLYAVWSPLTFKITYDVNGGDKLESSELDILFDSDISLQIPTKIGYEFKGWVDQNGLLFNFDRYTIAENITIKAAWEPKEYTITYKDWSDKVELTYDYNCNELITKKYEFKDGDSGEYEEPSRQNYVFTGWYLDQECKIMFNYPNIIDENYYLYAGWCSIEPYKDAVKIDPSLYTNFFEEYKMYCNSSKYTYAYFVSSINGKCIIDTGYFKDDFTVYPVLKIDNITQNKSISTIWFSYMNSPSITIDVKKGDLIMFSLRPENNNGGVYLRFSNYPNINENSIFSASLLNNYCEGKMHLETVKYNEKFNLLNNYREGYTFLGWYYNNNLISNDNLYTYDENIILEAKWKKNS